jgi:hypothetical protein
VTIRIEGNRTVETVLTIVFFPTRESKQESVRPRVKANSGTLSVLEDFVEVSLHFDGVWSHAEARKSRFGEP